MFINLSNHPSGKWPENQLALARQYGRIIDLPFPEIDPYADSPAVLALARDYHSRVIDIAGASGELRAVVHIMGEMTFCHALVKLLNADGITCLASTTRRVVVENGMSKTVEFGFCQFREYP